MNIDPIIKIRRSLLNRMAFHAGESYPHECCGILLGEDRGEKVVKEVVGTENIDLRRGRGRDRYRIDGRDFLRADRIAASQGLEIIGFYHSHPDYPGTPSGTDQAWAWPGYSYLIVSIQEGEAMECRSWVRDQNEMGWIEECIADREGEEGAGL